MTATLAGVRTNVAVGIAALLFALATWQIGSAWSQNTSTVVPLPISAAASVTPDPVQALDRITVNTTFYSSGESVEALRAEIAVTNSDGDTITTMSQSGFRIPAEGARAVYWEWRVPYGLDAGEYSLRLKVSGTDTGTVYVERDRVATFRVQ